MEKPDSLDIMDKLFIGYFGESYNKHLTTIEVNEEVSDGYVFCDYAQMDGVVILAHKMRLTFGTGLDSKQYAFSAEAVCEAIREVKDWYKVDSIDIRGTDLPYMFNLKVENDGFIMIFDEERASKYFEHLKETNALRKDPGYLVALQMLVVIDYTRYESAMQNQAAKLAEQGYTKEGLKLLAKYIDTVD